MARGSSVDLGTVGSITAVLGPTNTGKTHVAIQRMLGHRTGMIGLPLRLLAREVYDRVVAATGVDQVALVTGEEKKVPPQARYWICTVESMPVDRPVAFLAVDEVQLAGDPHRGHVFTDRILHARGVGETWFLGSDTIAPLLQELVPTVQIRSQPRLSRLSWSGSRKLVSLPPRSAVVAFSARRVYELAERLRTRHGGAAVVMGALSPRTRNAQVEMFQAGEVQHMVATDAIGMGLNMDVHHVALAGLHKFDGREHRPLRADEVAQIAGRAGRWKRDGTFGVTAGAELPDAEVVEAIERHRFPPLARLSWRNADLDFGSLDRLVSSLDAPPPRRFLIPVRQADDARVLRTLAREEEVLARLTGPDRVRLLWDVCGVPDFGNVLPEHHADLLRPLFLHLVDHDGRLPEDWVARQVARLDRVDGDIGTLMARIGGIRVWTYVSHRAAWLHDARAWQERTAAIEDRISDALHDKLTARFVDRRATVLARSLGGTEAQPVLHPSGEVTVAGEALGTLSGLTFHLAPGATISPLALKAVRRLAAPLVAERLEDLLASPTGAFHVDEEGLVRWDDAPVARLLPGRDWRRPKLRALRNDWLDGDDRGRLTARLERWLSDWLDGLLAPLDVELDDAAARGLRFVLRRDLGAVPRARVADLVDALGRGGREALKRTGVRVGRRWVVHGEVCSRAAERVTLWRVAHGEGPTLPEDGGVAPFHGAWPREVAHTLGFDRLGPWVVRADTLETVLGGDREGGRARGVDDETWKALHRLARGGGGRRRGRRRSR